MPAEPPAPRTLRLGARGSLLSRLQSGLVAQALQARHPGLQIQTIIVTTSGDQIQDRPLHEFGGKGLFTKELEQALLRGEVDFAVHSFKDVPVTMALVDTADLVIAATPQREDPRDVLACKTVRALSDLPRGAKVGTGSLRRQAQILALRPDLQVLPIRGNVDTRIRKMHSGDYDAVILALSGLKRANLFDSAIMTPIDTAQLLPAAGQGALALECRRDAPQVRDLLASLNHPPTAQAVQLERRIVQELHGDCHSPIAALAEISGSHITLRAAVARRDGHPPVIRAQATTPLGQSDAAVRTVLDQLISQGATALLAAPE